jgi:hypothetical protein
MTLNIAWLGGAICLCVAGACGTDGEVPRSEAMAKGRPVGSTVQLPEVDACKIVSQAEVEAAVGWKVDSTGPGAAQFAGSACNFYGKTISDLVGVAVASRGLTGLNSSAELAAFFSDTAKHGMFAVDAKPVEDLGVPAARFDMGWTVVTAIGKGRRRVDVTSPTEAASKTLMKKVLARLP